MGLFSLNESPFKIWMVANMKFWGFLPVFITWFLAAFLVGLLNPDADTKLLTWAVMAAIGASVVFSLIQENKAPLVLYTFFLSLPFIFLLSNHEVLNFITHGMRVYLWICLAISLIIGGRIGYYAYSYADDVIDKLFVFISSAKDRYEAELSIGYMRFVEAFIFTFIGLGVFAPIFA